MHHCFPDQAEIYSTHQQLSADISALWLKSMILHLKEYPKPIFSHRGLEDTRPPFWLGIWWAIKMRFQNLIDVDIWIYILLGDFQAWTSSLSPRRWQCWWINKIHKNIRIGFVFLFFILSHSATWSNASWAHTPLLMWSAIFSNVPTVNFALCRCAIRRRIVP